MRLDKPADGGMPVAAVCFPELTGPARPGDRVVLNTTAVDLALGSGGFHFVIARLNDDAGQPAADRHRGHVMKLRYTPLQLAVQAVDEEGSPWRSVMMEADSLEGQPVVIGSVHSHLEPAVAGVKARRPDARIAYVMTDGGALPAQWSSAVARLKGTGLLCGCITCGHAFGGDLEAVNVYSALLAARHVLSADVTVVAMGPGVVGVGTPFGHTALEVAPIVDGAAALGGQPIVIPRLSGADARPRHQGVSHHTLTALGRLTFARATVVLPPLPRSLADKVREQLHDAGVDRRHCIAHETAIPTVSGPGSARHVLWSSMGRTYEDDPPFFDAAFAAGWHAAGRIGTPRPS